MSDTEELLKRLEQKLLAEVFAPITAAQLAEHPAPAQFLLKAAYERSQRALDEGRIANFDDHDKALGPRWHDLFAVNAAEVLASESGVASLFGPPEDRGVEPAELERAIALLRAVDEPVKAKIYQRLLEIAEEENLWSARPDDFDWEAWQRGDANAELSKLEERLGTFQTDLYDRLDDYVREHAADFELPSYDDAWR